MYLLRTRIFHALPSTTVGTGFVVRNLVVPGPPISLGLPQLQPFVDLWAMVLVGMCYAVTLLSVAPPSDARLRVNAAIQVTLGTWVLVLTIALFFRPSDSGGRIGSDLWWHSRDYVLTGTVIGLGLFFWSAAWDLIHFQLASLQTERVLNRKLEEITSGEDDS